MAFQSIVGAKLVQYAIPASYINIYTAPVDSRVYVKDIDVCNTTSTLIYVYLHIVQSGSSAATTNALFYKIAVPAYTVMQWTGSQIMNSGDMIWVQASATGCTINITGGIAT